MVKKDFNFLDKVGLFKNKSAKESYNGILVFAAILGFLFLAGFVIAFASDAGLETAAVTMYNSTGDNITNPNFNFVINEGSNAFFKINVSSKDVGAPDTVHRNISQINVTFDNSFVITGYNMSNQSTFDAAEGNASFLNDSLTGNTFHWLNTATGGLLGGPNTLGTPGNATFEFNAINNIPGNYNVTVLIGNSTDTADATIVSISYINITINDTTAPDYVIINSNSTGLSSLSAVHGYPTTRANITDRTIYVSVDASDFNETGSGGIGYGGANIISVNFTLYNSTGRLNDTFVTSAGGINESFAINFTHEVGNTANLSDGHYYVNISSVDDRGRNINFTGIGFNITIDTVGPTVSLAKSGSSEKQKMVIDVTVSDSTSGIGGKQCSATGGGSQSIAMSGGLDGSQIATQEGLACGSSYTYTVTCTDNAGNSGSKEATLSTDSCSSSSSGGGGGGGGSSSSDFWILTYTESDAELSDQAVSSSLQEKYRVKLKIDAEFRYVGVIELTDTTAKINVTTANGDKEEVFNIGDKMNFDVNADNIYDLTVTLNGIADNKADLSVVYIQEEVPAETTGSITGSVVEEEVEEQEPEQKKKGRAWLWIIIALVVAGIAIGLVKSKK